MRKGVAINSVILTIFRVLCANKVISVQITVPQVREKVPAGTRKVLRVFSHFFFTAGKKTITPGPTPEEAVGSFEALSCKKVKTLGSFQLSKDDPANYTDKLTFLQQRRDLPEKYPARADADEDSGYLVKGGKAHPKTGGEPSTSAASEPVTPVVDPATLQLKQDLIDWHFQVVKLCQKIGIPDVCQTYKEARLENILKGLSRKDPKCKFCKKTYYNTQKLRNHIKGKHLKKTDHYCDQCKKYYADSNSLKVHMQSHDPEVSKFGCNYCDKLFTSKAQFEKHLSVHRGRQYSCQFCGNKYAHPQGVKEHEEKNCTKNPVLDPKDTSDWYKCRICFKMIKHHRSLLRNLRDQHDGAGEFE